MSMTTAGLDVRLREAEERAHLAENLISAATVLNEAGIRPDAPECRPLFDEIVRLPDEQSMRQHLREAASAPSRGKTYTRAARELLADTGEARPDGSYPIKDAEDVENAVADFNRSDGSDEDKAHIIKRAREVPRGTDVLPDDSVPVPSGETAVIDVEEFTVKLWRFSTRT